MRILISPSAMLRPLPLPPLPGVGERAARMPADLSHLLNRTIKVLYSDTRDGVVNNKAARGVLARFDDLFLHLADGRSIGLQFVVSIQPDNGGGDLR